MLQNVLFIDDDRPTNIINERLAERSNVFKSIQVYMNSVEALQYITELVKNDRPFPDLIFLDINMPALNGWQFLDAFKQLGLENKIKVVMLSTAVNIPEDKRENYQTVVSAFERKPLSLDKIRIHAEYPAVAS